LAGYEDIGIKEARKIHATEPKSPASIRKVKKRRRKKLQWEKIKKLDLENLKKAADSIRPSSDSLHLLRANTGGIKAGPVRLSRNLDERRAHSGNFEGQSSLIPWETAQLGRPRKQIHERSKKVGQNSG